MGGIRPKAGGRVIRGKIYDQYPRINARTRGFNLPEEDVTVPQIKINA